LLTVQRVLKNGFESRKFGHTLRYSGTPQKPVVGCESSWNRMSEQLLL
jgi:hypothetical protein